jgi:hypothetical protein
MLVIRAAQMRAMEDARLYDWLREFLAAQYPEEIAGADPDWLHRLLTTAIERARSYGFETQAEIGRYAHVAFLAGPHFDAAFPWAARTLEDKTLTNNAARLDRLESSVLDYLDTADVH